MYDAELKKELKKLDEENQELKAQIGELKKKKAKEWVNINIQKQNRKSMDILTGRMTTIDKTGKVVSQVMENYADRKESDVLLLLQNR